MSNNENKSITPLRKYIAIGYAVIALLIGGIVFIYLHEWRELERIEAESKEMNMLRQKVHDAYAQMLEENEELLNARQKMMHTITHELRIPLSSIIGYTGLLEEEEEETDEKVQQEYMGNIKQAAERMTSQLNILLSFFRLDCGKSN